MIKSIHQNSIDSFHALDRETRRKIILGVYEKHGRPLTDRQVAEDLGFNDLNSVRPRISEMIDDGVLVEVGKIKDFLTRVNVRLVRIKMPTEKNQQELFGFEVFNRNSGVNITKL